MKTCGLRTHTGASGLEAVGHSWIAAQNSYKGAERIVLRRLAKVLHRNQQSLDELSAEYYDSMADKLVDAAMDGDLRAIQKITEVIDE